MAYDDPWTRWRVNGRYFLNLNSDSADNDNNATFDMKRSWLFPESRWFAFAATRYQYDEFKAWEHRITLVAGPGLHLVDTEHHNFDVTLGPAFTREFGTADASKGEAMLGLSYDWKISKRQSFDLDNQFFVQLPYTVAQCGEIYGGLLRPIWNADSATEINKFKFNA